MSKLPAQPLFSVLIANYNNGRYLETCLQSILAQTYDNWEIVIVDDASTDDSHTVYERHRGDDRIRIFRNDRNEGCGYTKRKCVEHAKGQVCGFVDADDALAPAALQVMVKGHLDHPQAGIVYSTHYICDEVLQPRGVADYVGQIPPGRKSVNLFVPTISHFATFKRENYAQTEGISTMYPKAVDKDLYFKLEDTGPVWFIDQPLYFYRHHADSISLNQQASAAYYYEMTARALALLRQRRGGISRDDMPHGGVRLLGGMLIVIFYELKKKHFFVAMKLLMKWLSFLPVAAVGFFPRMQGDRK
jgi:glycosyltransferase involved in cell wall biosynthesis